MMFIVFKRFYSIDVYVNLLSYIWIKTCLVTFMSLNSKEFSKSHPTIYSVNITYM